MTTQTQDSVVRDGVHHHQFDIVIIGAGGAGMRAAIEAGPKATVIPIAVWENMNKIGRGLCCSSAFVRSERPT